MDALIAWLNEPLSEGARFSADAFFIMIAMVIIWSRGE